jgi:hypothetical protein
MPYADPQKQREAQARWYRKKYEADAKFRNAESDRKAAWLQTPEGKLSNAESSARFREKVLEGGESATRAHRGGKASGRVTKPAGFGKGLIGSGGRKNGGHGGMVRRAKTVGAAKAVGVSGASRQGKAAGSGKAMVASTHHTASRGKGTRASKARMAALGGTRTAKGGAGSLTDRGSKPKSSPIEYDESKPKDMRSFAKMVKTLQTAGVKFVIGRKGDRLTLLVGK